MDLTSASSVLGELLQSAWQDEIDAFLDERCREFTTLSYAAGGVVEYSHVQYSVWQDYRTLFSRVLDVILERVDGDTRQLIRLAEQRAEDIASGGVANSESAALERLLGAMIEYEDFTTFGATMRNRAGVMRRAERAGVEPSPRSPSASPRSPLRRTARPRRGSMMDEVVSMIAMLKKRTIESKASAAESHATHGRIETRAARFRGQMSVDSREIDAMHTLAGDSTSTTFTTPRHLSPLKLAKIMSSPNLLLDGAGDVDEYEGMSPLARLIIAKASPRSRRSSPSPRRSGSRFSPASGGGRGSSPRGLSPRARAAARASANRTVGSSPRPGSASPRRRFGEKYGSPRTTGSPLVAPQKSSYQIAVERFQYLLEERKK